MELFKTLEDRIPGYKPLEIRLKTSEDFLRIRETLTRIGVGSYKIKTLWQTCHIIHESGKYYICHFLEMKMIGGERVSISPDDIMRRNAVAKMLENWGLCDVVGKLGLQSPERLRVIPYKEKHEWNLVPKYTKK